MNPACNVDQPNNSLPPRENNSLPPRQSNSLPPRESNSLPPRESNSLPPQRRHTEAPQNRHNLPPYDRLSPSGDESFNHKDIIDNLSQHWNQYCDVPRFSLTSSESFEVIQNPSPTAQNRENLRSNIATLADYRQSLPESPVTSNEALGGHGAFKFNLKNSSKAGIGSNQIMRENNNVSFRENRFC